MRVFVTESFILDLLYLEPFLPQKILLLTSKLLAEGARMWGVCCEWPTRISAKLLYRL